jgi:SAM-dependent methyltransferase
MKQPLGERVKDSLRLRALDVKDRLGGRSDRLVPPRRLDFVGHSDFVETGDEFLGHFVELGGLQPSHDVLDIGCGIGRMARPLSGYLDAGGSYEGFDVNREGVGWCRRRYARFKNFHFQVADLYNRRYNPHGPQKTIDYRFPYPDERFDFAIMASVLTHLLEDEAEHYLAETARVLKPGGRAVTTFFLLDAESRQLIAAGKSGLDFLEPEGHVSVLSDDVPEEAVAYDEGWVYERVGTHGLRVLEPIRPGTWCGREGGVSFQDIVVLEKVG